MGGLSWKINHISGNKVIVRKDDFKRGFKGSWEILKIFSLNVNLELNFGNKNSYKIIFYNRKLIEFI